LSNEKIESPDRALKRLGNLFKERNALYGDNYLSHGKVMMALFSGKIPKQITVEDANRFGIFTQMVSKMTRYANRWDEGHQDSLDDLSVYSQMLSELDKINEGRER
jgi:hypothetical protein